MKLETVDALDRRMMAAWKRYGDFASTHEALGVACEEWDELRAAVHANALGAVEHECLDLAAVLIRMAEAVADEKFKSRSVK